MRLDYAVGIACAMVVLVLAVVLAFDGELLGFDGVLGPGCDIGNDLCTFEEWRPDCLKRHDNLLNRCTLEIYRASGGHAL